jgi:DNA (cytosine-5)-methyltransferase 1
MKTHLDLFSGIGGFAIAAQACGYTTIGFCEKEKYAQQILKERFGAVLADATELQRNGCEHHAGSDSEKRGQVSESGNGSRPRLHPDIFTLNGADYAGVDLLTGGFPCQPFSVAGKRKGAADERALWPEMLRVIDGAKPAWLIGENVAGIVTMELDNIISDLEGIGYAAWPLVIPACAVDARHRRDRVWIVAHAEGGERSEPEAGNRRQVLTGGSENHGECASWLPEPELGRVAHGIPHRAHRLRGLGNAIVPQVAYEIIRAIPPHIPGREIALATGAGMM